MSTAPANQRILVVAGLLFHAGRLLVARRRPGDHLGGCWEFPGGKLEPGETAVEALRRELREELGIDVAVGALFAEVAHDYPDRGVHLQFFCCRLVAGEPRTLGCDAIAWVTPMELSDFDFPPADLQLLARLRTSPELWLPDGI